MREQAVQRLLDGNPRHVADRLSFDVSEYLRVAR